jgi:transcription elongation factor Elf1
MVNYVDLHYISQFSRRLKQYKIKSTSPYRINFRCPFCGDSQKSQYKARAWFIEDKKDGSLFFHCFNCSVPIGSLQNFLKKQDLLLYKQYIAEKYIHTTREVPQEVPEKKESHIYGTIKGLKKISQLKYDHPVKQYIEKRKIPTNKHYKLYYTPKFFSWVNSIIPNKFTIEKDEPRLVIPLMDKSGNMLGVSARGFNPKGLRYITIMFNESSPKLFGLDDVDFSKTFYIVEGSLDSLFLENSIAMVGADGSLNGIENKENAVFVFDNEKRNKEIHKRMDMLISRGYSICIWPTWIQEKDINDMVLAGIENIKELIDTNTVKGLEAMTKLIEWKRT